MSEEQQWAANKHFLDKIATTRDHVFLSVPKGDIRPNSPLAREIKYLTEHKGYQWVNQWSLRPTK